MGAGVQVPGEFRVCGQCTGGSGSLEKCSSCQEFSNPTTWRGDMEQKLHFQDNIRLWVLRMFILKKQPPFVLQFFKSDYLEEEIWAKTTFWSEKKKTTPFCHGIVQIKLFGEEIWHKNCIFQDNIGHGYSKNSPWKKNNHLLSWIFFSNLTTWRGYMEQKLHFPW